VPNVLKMLGTPLGCLCSWRLCPTLPQLATGSWFPFRHHLGLLVG